MTAARRRRWGRWLAGALAIGFGVATLIEGSHVAFGGPDLKTLFKRLKSRASALKAGGESNEMAMLIAVFGLAALPATAFPFVEKLYPQPRSESSGSSDRAAT